MTGGAHRVDELGQLVKFVLAQGQDLPLDVGQLEGVDGHNGQDVLLGQGRGAGPPWAAPAL